MGIAAHRVQVTSRSDQQCVVCLSFVTSGSENWASKTEHARENERWRNMSERDGGKREGGGRRRGIEIQRKAEKVHARVRAGYLLTELPAAMCVTATNGGNPTCTSRGVATANCPPNACRWNPEQLPPERRLPRIAAAPPLPPPPPPPLPRPLQACGMRLPGISSSTVPVPLANR